MKIAYIGSAHPLRGGLAAFNENLSEKLIAKGHDVTIYSFSLQYPSFLSLAQHNILMSLHQKD